MVFIFLNDRRHQLLLEIINNNELKIKNMAKKFNVSERTIRYDIDIINDFLYKKHLPVITKKRSGLITFNLDINSKVNVTNMLNCQSNEIYEYALSTKQRVYVIINEFLLSDDCLTIDNLAEKLDVSRNTIINDLKKVKTWLLKNKLKLSAVPKCGLRIVSKNEKRIRIELINMYKESTTLEQYLDLIKSTYDYSKSYEFPQIMYEKLFRNIKISEIQYFINDLQNRLKVVFSDITYCDLIIYIAVAIQRLRLNRSIVIKKENILNLHDTKAFDAAIELSKLIKKNYKVEMDDYEVTFITQYILASSGSTGVVIEDMYSALDIQMMISSLIVEVSKALGIDMTRNLTLFNSLYDEMQSIIYKQNHGIKIDSPYLNEIKISYKKIFDAIKSNVISLNNYKKFEINDDIIGCMSLHFAACLEEYNCINVLVVCATGFGTAKLLAIKLTKLFNINIVKVAALHEVKTLLKNKKVDLIITSAPFISEKIPCVLVNPILPKEDIAVLRQCIYECQQKKLNAENNIDIVSNSYYNAENQFLSKKICENDQYSLNNLITPESIELDVSVDSWEDAIKYGGNILCRNGSIDKLYIQSIINNVKELGPYFVYWKGIALPHSERIDYVKKLGVSFIRLKKPVLFHNRNNDPVDMVFIFATPNKKCHIKAMMQLTEMLSNSKNTEKLRKACIKEDVIKIINENL